jgi:hypothetical protein
MVEIKTDETLLSALREAAKRKATPEQAHKQRVSYIMGALGRSSGVTREKVEKVLAAQEGRLAS